MLFAISNPYWEFVIGAAFVAALLYAIRCWFKHNTKRLYELPAPSEELVEVDPDCSQEDDTVVEGEDTAVEGTALDKIDLLSMSNMGNEGGNE